MSEANRDEALKCLHISQKHWSSGDQGAALKYAMKGVSLYETREGRTWLDKVRAEWTDEVNTSQQTAQQPETKSKSPEKKAESTTNGPAFTAAQLAEVKRFTKLNKNDYYALLAVSKAASDADIKKAYRKVTLRSLNLNLTV